MRVGKHMNDNVKSEVAALIEKLGHENPWLRSGAAISLGLLGTEAVAAIPHLIAVRNNKNEDRDLRRNAVPALAKIATDTAVVIPYLIAALSDEDEMAR